MGASSRAAGIVRAQGGTPATVALGRWSIDFYRRQAETLGTDSGFRELGYLILAVTDDDERAGRERVEMQRREGLDVALAHGRRGGRDSSRRSSRDGHRGGSYLATDGCIDPPRNVRAYSLAMQAAGVELRERTAFEGLLLEPTPGGGRRVVGVETSRGPIATDRVLLTGGPSLRAVGRTAGVRIPAGAARHTVAVLEPHEAFDVERMPMVFDIGCGPVLAARGGRTPVRLERPGRVARRGPIDQLADVRRGAGRGWPGSSRSLATSGSAGSGRRRSTTRRTTCRSSGRR